MTRSWNPAARIAAVGLVVLAAGGELRAQDAAERAFVRSAASYFGVEPGEAAFLAERLESTVELPVVLHLARSAGISAEAVLAMRSRGLPWGELLPRYGLHAGALHVPLERVPEGGALAAAYQAFEARPRNAWPVINLSDASVVALVNLAFLADHLELPPGRVADALARSGDPVLAYRDLLRRRLP